MYNIKDILTEYQKKILKKNKIDFDIIIHNDDEMRGFVGKVFDEVAGFDNIQEIADRIVDCHNNSEVREKIINLNKLKSIILELTDGISLRFKNKDIYIEPYTKENIKVYYENEVYNYKNVDDLLEAYIIDGYSLTDIIDELEIN